MTRTIRIRPEAEADLTEAYRWYSKQAEGLGEELLTEVDRTLETIGENPSLYAKLHKNVRRALTKRFPYGIFFWTKEKRLLFWP